MLAGAAPALGSTELTVEFINDRCGAPLPDLLGLAYTRFEDLVSIRFVGTAAGAFADGSAGKVHVAQVGLFHNGFHGAVGDGFPAENITFTKAGTRDGTVAEQPLNRNLPSHAVPPPLLATAPSITTFSSVSIGGSTIDHDRALDATNLLDGVLT